jgi:hypothetical protein
MARRACHLLQRHALSPFAVPAGLCASATCMRAFLAAAAPGLERGLGLGVTPAAHRELWPAVEPVSRRRRGGGGARLARCPPALHRVHTQPGLLASWNGVPPPPPAPACCLQALRKRVRRVADAVRRAVDGEVAAAAAGSAARAAQAPDPAEGQSRAVPWEWQACCEGKPPSAASVLCLGAAHPCPALGATRRCRHACLLLAYPRPARSVPIWCLPGGGGRRHGC